MSLKPSANLWYYVLSAISDGLIVTDTGGSVLFMNYAAEQLTGWKAGEAQNKKLDDIFILISEVSIKRYVLPINDILKKSGTVDLPENLILVNKDLSKESFISGNSSVIMDDHGIALGIVTMFRDINSEREKESQIRYYSFYDSLTGLYNRAFFEEELKRLDTTRMLPLSIVLGDANGLKLVNDAFGHMEGDKLLRKVASAFKEVCRKEDIIARVGGDEFVIILPKVGKEEADTIINRIREYCFSLSTSPIRTSISLGCATKEFPDQDIHEIYRQAEECMYTAKLAESREIRNEIIGTIRQSLEERTHETQAHGDRLKELALQLGRKIGLNETELGKLELLAMIHDIGKIAIPESILAKPGALCNKEWHIMKKHCEIGYRIAIYSPELVTLADGILSHHEHWDGSGYPQGLKGENIPLISRIIAIVDAYDVLTHGRAYQKAISSSEALAEIRRCSGTQFDPNLVENFVSIFERPEEQVTCSAPAAGYRVTAGQ